jgi:hypothetical protein
MPANNSTTDVILQIAPSSIVAASSKTLVAENQLTQSLCFSNYIQQYKDNLSDMMFQDSVRVPAADYRYEF